MEAKAALTAASINESTVHTRTQTCTHAYHYCCYHSCFLLSLLLTTLKLINSAFPSADGGQGCADCGEHQRVDWAPGAPEGASADPRAGKEEGTPPSVLCWCSARVGCGCLDCAVCCGLWMWMMGEYAAPPSVLCCGWCMWMGYAASCVCVLLFVRVRCVWDVAWESPSLSGAPAC